jgi:hypothetical protein
MRRAASDWETDRRSGREGTGEGSEDRYKGRSMRKRGRGEREGVMEEQEDERMNRRNLGGFVGLD